MYNEEIKSRFINEFSTSIARREAAKKMFDVIEQYEEKWEADVCTRSKEELQPVIDAIVGARSSSYSMRFSILRAYVRWCIQNNIADAQDGVSEINEAGLGKLKRQTVANPQHLQRYLDCICDKDSEKTVSCVYRCFYWLAYGGVLSEEEALDIIASDVDFDNMVVRHGDQEYPIYREAISSFKNCVNLTVFKYNHRNYSSEKETFKIRANGNTLLRGLSETKSIYSIRVEMSRRAKKFKVKDTNDIDNGILGLELSYYRVWLSGLFYRTYEAERAGMPVDFTAVAEQFMENKTYKLGSGRNKVSAKKRALANDYLTDYNRWKEAYSI